MRAAYVLGPGLDNKALRVFQQPGCELEQFSPEHNAAPPDALLVFGGDGTLHHELEFLVRTLTPLHIVPCGSGNDFAKTLGLHTPSDSVELWRQFCATKAHVRKLDLGVISLLDRRLAPTAPDIYFCNVAGAGLDAAQRRDCTQHDSVVGHRCDRISHWNPLRTVSRMARHEDRTYRFVA